MRKTIPGAVLILAFLARPASSQTPPSSAYGIVWVGSSTGLKKIRTNDGALVLEIGDAKDCRTIATDGIAETVWCYGPENQLRSWTFEGTPIVNVSVPVLPNWGMTYNGRPVLFEPFPPEVMGTLEDDPLFRDYVAMDVDPATGDVYLAIADEVLGFDASGVSNGFTYSLNGYTVGLAVDSTKPTLSLWLSQSRNLNPLFFAGQTNRVFEIRDGFEYDLMLPADGVLSEFDLDAAHFDTWVAYPSLVRKAETWPSESSSTFPVRDDVAIAGADLRQIDGDSAGGAWLAEAESLLRLTEDGTVAFEVVPFGPEIRVVDIAVESRDQSLWVASKAILKHFESSGTEVHSVILDPLLRIRAIAVYTDPEPPHIVFTTPPSGSVITSGFPTFTLEYDDVGLGVEPTTLSVIATTAFPNLNCTAGGLSATCVPADVAPDGFHMLIASIADAGGNYGTAWTSFSVWKDTSPPAGPDGTLIDVSYSGGSATVTGDAGSVEPGATVRITNSRTGEVVLVTAAADGSFTATIAANPMDKLSVVALDSASNASEPTLLAVPPPNPSAIASTIDPTVPFDMASATAFLYEGANKLQHGVAPGAIDPLRVSVLRGTVKKSSGDPLSGVLVTVPSQPELGYTVSRADGGWDLAVNGGGALTLRFARESYLTADRQVDASWRDFVAFDDVHLTRLDSAATDVDFLATTTSMQIVSASVESDTDGTRQARLLIPSGTTAELVFPDGTTEPLPGGRLRASEYSVGPNGPSSGFATAPPTTGYTYGIELSADEEIRAGAHRVEFDKTVYHLTENFLEFPVGMPIPNGYWDRVEQRWIGEADGRVIEIFGVSGGLAEVVIDDSGLPASASDLADLGFTNEELAVLATLYTAGTELWRVPITHFSPRSFDCPTLFVIPGGKPTSAPPDPTNDCEQNAEGSIIGCRNQTLGESIPLTGTGVRLAYQSDRAKGFLPHIEIPLTGASLPTGLSKVLLEVTVAGVTTKATYSPPIANLVHVFTWDRKDAYGRELQGAQPVKIRVGYVFPSSYLRPASTYIYQTTSGDSSSFGLASESLATMGTARGAAEVTSWQDIDATIGGFDGLALGLGGFSLDVHHVYDPATRIFYFGDGSRQDDVAMTVRNIAGRGPFTDGFSGDGRPAYGAQLNAPVGVTAGPDGSVYIADTYNHRIRKIDRAGNIRTIAGNGISGFSGDGGAATSASLWNPQDVAVAADGTLYIADSFNRRIRKVTPDGTISTIAGTGVNSSSGDGGPATSAAFMYPLAVEIGPDRLLYVVDFNGLDVRKIDSEGRIQTVAGGGSGGIGDGLPATSAELYGPVDVAFSPDGTMFVADYWQNRVRRVGPDGIISTYAGTGEWVGAPGDEGDATDAVLASPNALAVGRDGTLFIACEGIVRAVTPDRKITTWAGSWDGNVPDYGCAGGGGAPRSATFTFPSGMDLAPDGSLLIADNGCNYVRRITSPLPSVGPGTKAVPRSDGGTLYVFDESGRHLETRDTLLNVARLKFAYDAAGRVTTVTDVSANALAVQRVGANPTAIVAPGGQTTSLTVDPSGYLATISNPAGEAFTFIHDSTGLLTTLETPRGHEYSFTYDTRGRLLQDEDPAGGSQTLTRTVSGNTVTSTRETALGRTWSYGVKKVGTTQIFSNERPDGTVVQTSLTNDEEVVTTYPDGSSSSVVFSGDPRFGSAAPMMTRATYKTPAGKTLVVEESRTATLRNPADIFSLESAEWARTVNGKEWSRAWEPATRRFTFHTPENRYATVDLDEKGRVRRWQAGERAPVELRYDSRGRVDRVTVAEGADARIVEYTYDSANRVTQVMDPLGRVTTFSHDAADRVVEQVSVGDGRVIEATYDASGNLATLSPPGKPAHSFEYSPIDRETKYLPPVVPGSGATVTDYEYSQDRELEKIIRPDLAAITLTYDAGGRATAIVHTHGAIALEFDSVTGQLVTTIADSSETLSFGWDGDLPTSQAWSGTINGSVERSFNDDLRLVTETVNGGHAATYTYDSDGNVIVVGGLSIFRSASDALIDSTTLGVVSTTRQYNVFAEPTLETASASAGEIYRAEFERDKLGRIIEKEETVEGVTTVWAYTYL